MIGKTLKANKKNFLVQFLVGLVAGGGGAYLVLSQREHLDLAQAHIPGMAVAALLLILTSAIFISTLTKAGVAEMVGGELDPGEDLGPEVQSLRWQAFVGGLAAVELAILSLSIDILRGASGSILLAILALILAAQTWFNLKLWRSGDELFRQVIVESMLIGFLAFQFLMFFWVVGSRFDLIPDPSALDVYVMMMVLYLVGSGIAGVRRGYAEMG